MKQQIIDLLNQKALSDSEILSALAAAVEKLNLQDEPSMEGVITINLGTQYVSLPEVDANLKIGSGYGEDQLYVLDQSTNTYLVEVEGKGKVQTTNNYMPIGRLFAFQGKVIGFYRSDGTLIQKYKLNILP